MIRRGTTALLALSLTFTSAGCKEDEKPADAPASASASGAATTEATAAADAKKAKSAVETGSADGTASSHVPAGCEVAARFDIKKTLEQDKIGKVLVDALSKIQSEPKDADQKKAVAALKTMEIDLTKDVHEVALCVNDVLQAKGNDPPPFMLLVSGNIKKDSLIPALKEQDAKVTDTEVAGIKAVKGEKEEIIMGQSDDGVVIVAHGKDGFEKAVKAQGEGMKEHAIPADKSSALVVKGSLIQEALKKQKQNPLEAHTGNIEGLVIYWDIDAMKTEIRAKMTSEKAAIEFGGALKMILTELSKPNPRNPFAGVATALSKAKIDNDGNDTTIIIEMSEQEADAAMAELTKTLGSL